MTVYKRARLINIAFVLACLGVVVWVISAPRDVFSNAGFMPHGHCYLWTPLLVWTMVTTDALIGLAYLSISICLYVLVRRIRLPFSAMFLAFGAFIAACGTTHFMSIYTLWWPNYWLDAFIKVITALASVATAILMFPLIPKVLEFTAAARLSEERKRQLEEVNLELQARTESLTLANRELEAFSYSVSHDLRTPLRGIDGFSAALLEDCKDLDEQSKQYLHHVRSGAQRMGEIIDDLLNLARINRIKISPQPVNLSQIAEETIKSLQSAAPDRQISVFVQQGVGASGDPGLLRILIENLLSNAWKFTSKALGASIEFGSQRKADETIYFVRDNGVGFDMKFSDKLFTAFQRLHSSEQYSGTGVGLATAKRIVERHGGRIWSESSVGKGTTFYFSLGGTK